MPLIGGTAWLKPRRNIKKRSTRVEKVARAFSRAEQKLGSAEASCICQKWLKRGYGGARSGPLHDKGNGIISMTSLVASSALFVGTFFIHMLSLSLSPVYLIFQVMLL
jgi:hypothetical protein